MSDRKRCRHPVGKRFLMGAMNIRNQFTGQMVRRYWCELCGALGYFDPKMLRWKWRYPSPRRRNDPR